MTRTFVFALVAFGILGASVEAANVAAPASQVEQVAARPWRPGNGLRWWKAHRPLKRDNKKQTV